ncbi:hypothetical protein EVA_22134 [gut metagenome]|uniref:Uncharacterized protein n=1 Tax=gut metagenome TaxID=749906 RepID=J9BQA3_9ZZZZ
MKPFSFCVCSSPFRAFLLTRFSIPFDYKLDSKSDSNVLYIAY